MFSTMLEKIRGKETRIVFPEGCDGRILNAVARLYAEKVLVPILLGNKEEVKATAVKSGVNIEGIKIIDPLNYKGVEEMVQKMVVLRKGKMDAEACASALKKTNYFGTMLVAMGEADGLVGGATYSTADTVRPALQLVKTKPESHIVSSAFILTRNNEKIVMADCAINIMPNEDEIIEITLETAKTARVFGVEPKVGLLSYSSKGSARGESVDKMSNATKRLQSMNLDYEVDGEFQFDCAISSSVADIKAPQSKVAGKCNTFIFPTIDAGNIGYKIAQRLGGFEAVGPILQGLNAPINDLSRGCTADEVYKVAIITAAQKYI